MSSCPSSSSFGLEHCGRGKRRNEETPRGGKENEKMKAKRNNCMIFNLLDECKK
jgi:hypothetical protein